MAGDSAFRWGLAKSLGVVFAVLLGMAPQAAAQALRRGGAASVSALVLARTPAPGEDDSW